jgi:hypothetical protein
VGILNGGHLGFFQALLVFFSDFLSGHIYQSQNLYIYIYIYHKPHNDTQKLGLSQKKGLKHARKDKKCLIGAI